MIREYAYMLLSDGNYVPSCYLNCTEQTSVTGNRNKCVLLTGRKQRSDEYMDNSLTNTFAYKLMYYMMTNGLMYTHDE